jgi:type I restriction enzyme, S subunit
MSEWSVATLQQLADIRVSNVDKKITPGELPVRLCNYMDAYSNEYVHAELPFMEASASAIEIAKFKVDRGDVLITKDSETPFDIGIPAVVVDDIEDLVCGYHLALIKPKSELIDSVFLAKQLGSSAAASYFSRYAAGSTRYGLSNGAIARIFIPLAPLGQQKKIAAILTSIDTAIENTEALIEKYQQIKAGLMHDLFTRGVLPNGQLRPTREQAPHLYQQTAIGWIPKEWVFTTCEKVCEKIIDCKNRTPPETPDGYPVIRTPNVRNGEFVDNELLFTDSRSYEVWTMRGKPQVGDVLITREAPVGEVCMIPERHVSACLGQRMMLYRPNREVIEPTYFLFALQSRQIKNRLDLISGGSTVGHVRVGDIRQLWMFMPKVRREQVQIATALSAVSARLRAEVCMRDKYRDQKLGLMQDLLTGKIQVNVDSEAAELVSG